MQDHKDVTVYEVAFRAENLALQLVLINSEQFGFEVEVGDGTVRELFGPASLTAANDWLYGFQACHSLYTGC